MLEVGLEGKVGGREGIRVSRHYSEGARSKTDLSAKAHLFCGCCFKVELIWLPLAIPVRVCFLKLSICVMNDQSKFLFLNQQ